MHHFVKINLDFATGKAVNEGGPGWRDVGETKTNKKNVQTDEVMCKTRRSKEEQIGCRQKKDVRGPVACKTGPVIMHVWLSPAPVHCSLSYILNLS